MAYNAQVQGALDQKAKVTAKDAAGEVLSGATKTALASGATDAQLREIGMARPAKPVRPFALVGPTGLLATTLPEAQVWLAWDRGGNRQGTTFEILASATGLDADYAIVATTTRASFTLDGQAPGVAAWYKVWSACWYRRPRTWRRSTRRLRRRACSSR